MKPIRHFGTTHPNRVVVLRSTLVLLSVALFQSVSAQDNQSKEPATSTSSVSVSNAVPAVTKADAEKTKVTTVAAEPALSPAVNDILKMSKANVSTEVIVSFIQHSRVEYVPTASDLIALKESGVSDEVTSALMKRASQIETQTARVKADPVMPTVVRQLSRGSYVDPDSYDFWYYHYAYPRALSYSYRTLAPYNLGYGYGYRGGPVPYGRFYR